MESTSCRASRRCLGGVAGKPVIGVPGYPVSAIVIAREILRPALEKFLGAAAPSYPSVHAVVPKKIASHLGLEEFIRVSVGRVENKLVAVPLATRRRGDYNHGSCRWIIAHSKSRRRIKRR